MCAFRQHGRRHGHALPARLTPPLAGCAATRCTRQVAHSLHQLYTPRYRAFTFAHILELKIAREQVLERWRRVLTRHGGSGRLWRAFLAWRRCGGGGGAAAVGALRQDYADGLLVPARPAPNPPRPAAQIVPGLASSALSRQAGGSARPAAPPRRMPESLAQRAWGCGRAGAPVRLHLLGGAGRRAAACPAGSLVSAGPLSAPWGWAGRRWRGSRRGASGRARQQPLWRRRSATGWACWPMRCAPAARPPRCEARSTGRRPCRRSQGGRARAAAARRAARPRPAAGTLGASVAAQPCADAIASA